MAGMLIPGTTWNGNSTSLILMDGSSVPSPYLIRYVPERERE